MEATTTSRVLLPFRAAPPRAAAAGAVAWPRRRAGTRRRIRLVPARASLDRAAVLLDAAVGTGYSQASYYTSLGLFVLSVPGLWSLIKRSVKSKIVQKTFVKEEGQPMAPNLVAGEILSFFTRNSFTVSDRGEVITFEGRMIPSRGQAALLTFCTCISLGSVGLVLSIAVPEGGNNWFWLMTLSPLAYVSPTLLAVIQNETYNIYVVSSNYPFSIVQGSVLLDKSIKERRDQGEDGLVRRRERI
ncbi:hypothetical protein BRADI_3g36577v3 [Brachypodium distachyon]|uniref:Uncharacterized protein n=1 Tax=Brachypodium distachyon TaxID=15368 RepID=A0A0Q3FFG0_BRADI|nr:hypothetical protein BRADI_3g36577v3 [Brachypodium distachyon]